MPLRNIFIPFKTGVISAQRLIFACCALGAVALPATAWAANIGIGSGIRVDPPVRSMKDMRDQGLVKQRFDYSCGAAALATILRHGFGEKVTERQILVQLFDLLSDEEKKVSREKGFSLLDLQRVARARGYKAQGFRLEPRYLSRLGGPVIVFIEPRGYKHFVVLRGCAATGSISPTRRAATSDSRPTRSWKAGSRKAARGSSSWSSRRPVRPATRCP